VLSSPIDILWLAFVVYWAVSGRRAGAAVHRDDPKMRLGINALLLLGGVFVFGHALPWGRLGDRFVGPLAAVRSAALLLVVAGLGLAVWARVHLGRFWTGDVGIQGHHELVRTGPYGRVRHPIYSGVLVASIGTALWIGEIRAVIGVLFLTVGLSWKARREERFMFQELGARYASYRESAGFLVPRRR
jgi:protein-S-isoprenylcysteine O-methyltransferase Ste14